MKNLYVYIYVRNKYNIVKTADRLYSSIYIWGIFQYIRFSHIRLVHCARGISSIHLLSHTFATPTAPPFSILYYTLCIRIYTTIYMDRKSISAYSCIFYTFSLWLNSRSSYRFLTGKYIHIYVRTCITNNITENVNENLSYIDTNTYNIHVQRSENRAFKVILIKFIIILRYI